MKKLRAAVLAACLAITVLFAAAPLASAASASPAVAYTPPGCDHFITLRDDAVPSTGDGSVFVRAVVHKWTDFWGNYCGYVQMVTVTQSGQNNEHSDGMESALYRTDCGGTITATLNDWSSFGIDVNLGPAFTKFYYYGDTVYLPHGGCFKGFAFASEKGGDEDYAGGYGGQFTI